MIILMLLCMTVNADTLKFECINNTLINNTYCICPMECSYKIRNNTCILNKCYNITNNKCIYNGYMFVDILKIHLVGGLIGATYLFIGRYDIVLIWTSILLIQIMINIYISFKNTNNNGEKINNDKLKNTINYMFFIIFSIFWACDLLMMINGTLLDGNGCMIK